MDRRRWSLERARAFVGTKFLLIAGLVGFVVVAWLAELITGLHRPVDLGPLLAGLMATVPAVLWLGVFYLMDRHEPEPKNLVAGVCVLGLTQEVCKYAVVRYTIYTSREFDEPMDGIVYMMACGTGFAVWINYHRLSGQGHHVILSTGAAQAVVTTLAHASFAGFLGYVMGRAKFSQRTAFVRGSLLMAGLLGAAVFNGMFKIVARW